LRPGFRFGVAAAAGLAAGFHFGIDRFIPSNGAPYAFLLSWQSDCLILTIHHMADPARSPQDMFSIVIVGVMNPAIHQPRWYHLLKLIDDAELESAEKTPGNVIVAAEGSQLIVPGLTIVCTPRRWEVRTTELALANRILATTCTTFEALFHTPVEVYGFNFHHHKRTSNATASQFLAKSLGAQWGLGMDERDRAEVSFVEPRSEVTVTTVIAPSGGGPDMVHVRINKEYRVQSKELHFDLSALLRERYMADLEWAARTAERIAGTGWKA
jgi:hypothetical protein